MQYVCREIHKLLQSYRILQSMAARETAGATPYQIPNLQYDQARIEIWYNKKRKPSYLNYLTPEQFEKSNQSKAA